MQALDPQILYSWSVLVERNPPISEPLPFKPVLFKCWLQIPILPHSHVVSLCICSCLISTKWINELMIGWLEQKHCTFFSPAIKWAQHRPSQKCTPLAFFHIKSFTLTEVQRFIKVLIVSISCLLVREVVVTRCGLRTSAKSGVKMILDEAGCTTFQDVLRSFATFLVCFFEKFSQN